MGKRYSGACVYTHTNGKTGEIFYVGKSKNAAKRPFLTCQKARSQRYHSYVHEALGGKLVPKYRGDI